MHLSDKTRRAANRAIFSYLGDRFKMGVFLGKQPESMGGYDRELLPAMWLTLAVAHDETGGSGDLRLHIVSESLYDVSMEGVLSNEGWFRIFSADLETHAQGTAGPSGSGADLEINPDPSCMGGYALTLDVGLGKIEFE